MKCEYRNFDNEIGIYLKSESAEDTFEIVNIAQQIKKPAQSFGSITKDGAYVWIKIPVMKREYRFTDIGNKK